jgi:hypothetical protein
VRRAFLWREKRKVRRDATLSLQGNHYQVDPQYAGRTLELRFDPFDLTQVELYLDRTLVSVATVMIQNRQRHLAVEHLATETPDPPKPHSSLDYVAALRAEHHAQQQRELGPLQLPIWLRPTSSQRARQLPRRTDMFQEFYGFTRVPFSRTIATQDLFPTAGQKELNARRAVAAFSQRRPARGNARRARRRVSKKI